MRVAVIGGGATGALVAIALSRMHAADQVTVIEPSPRIGAGLAYSTTSDLHLLNVRAAGMSAHADDDRHFVRWSGAGADDYLPRHRFASYLESCLPDSVDWLRASARSLSREDRGLTVNCDDHLVAADRVIVATGLGPAQAPADLVIAPEAASAVVHDPWSAEATSEAHGTDPVIVIGAGLTAIDVAVSVLSASPDSRVTLLSRTGLIPRAHEAPPLPPHPPRISAGELAAGLPLEDAAARLAGPDWRQSVDGLRPVSHALWAALGGRRREFVERWLRQWDVHRHRMAPQVAALVAEWRRQGRLVSRAGDTRRAESTRRGGIALQLSDGTTLTGQRLVVATGPSNDPMSTPFLASLIASGDARPGPLRWGIDVDPQSLAVRRQDGRAQPDLLAVGPITRGVFLESTAVPDIRAQAAQIASAIASRA